MSVFPESVPTVRRRRSNGNVEFVRRHNSNRNSRHEAFKERCIADRAQHEEHPYQAPVTPHSALLERDYFTRRPEEREHYHLREAQRGRSIDRLVGEPASISSEHQVSSVETASDYPDPTPRYHPSYAPSTPESRHLDERMYQPLDPSNVWSRPGRFEDEYMSGALIPVEDQYFHGQTATTATTQHPESHSRTSSVTSRSHFRRARAPIASRPGSGAFEGIDYRAIQESQDRLVAFAMHESQHEARNRGYVDAAGEDEDISRAVRNSIVSFTEDQKKRVRGASRSQSWEREEYPTPSRPPTPSPYAESIDATETDRPATLLPGIEPRPMPSLHGGSTSRPRPRDSKHDAPSRSSRPEAAYPNSSTVSSTTSMTSRSSSSHRRVQWADQSRQTANDTTSRRPQMTSSARLTTSTGRWMVDSRGRADRLPSVQTELEERLRERYPQATGFQLRRDEVRSGSYDGELLVFRDGHYVRGIEIRSAYDDMDAVRQVIRILDDS